MFYKVLGVWLSVVLSLFCWSYQEWSYLVGTASPS